jgi:hypothetical protein
VKKLLNNCATHRNEVKEIVLAYEYSNPQLYLRGFAFEFNTTTPSQKPIPHTLLGTNSTANDCVVDY